MGHPQIVQCEVLCGRRALERGGTQVDPTMSLRKIIIRGLSDGARMSCWPDSPCRVVY
jgi:hypothetical protein